MVRAAERLHVAQPALSRGLAELEEILEVRLFDRTPRGVVPTEFGEAFTQHARNVLAQLGRAGSHLAELAAGRRGTVTVGTHLFGSNILLPQAITTFKAEAPEATVAVHLGTPDDLFADLRAGRADLVVGRLQPLLEVSRETATPLYEEPIALVARRDHPVHDQPCSLASLMDKPWVVPVNGTVLRTELEALLARHGLGLPTNRVECTGYLTVHRLIVTTDAIGLLPALVVTEDPRMRPLALLPELSQTIGVTTVEGRSLPPSARLLVEHLTRAGHYATGLIDALPPAPRLLGV